MNRVALVVLCGAIAVSCQKTAVNPTAPSNVSLDIQPADSTIYYLHVDSSNFEETEDALGHYLYTAKTLVRNSSGRDLTVTSYQVQALWASTLVATKSTAPYVLVPAYSSRTIAYTFSTGYSRLYGHPVVTWVVKVGYRDRYGNTGSVSATYTIDGCPGCWDY